MDLTTRCPNCGTVFQASLSDLQLRKGYIRCVQCAHIFDGYAEVVRDPERADAAPAGPVAAGHPEPGGEPRPEAWPARAPADDDPEEPAPRVIRAGRPASWAGSRPPEPEFRVGVAPWPADGRDTAGHAWDEPHVGLDAREPSGEDGPASTGWRTEPEDTRDSIVVEAHPGYRGTGGSAAPLLRDDAAPGMWSSTVRFFSGLLLVLLAFLLVAQLAYVYRGRIAQFSPRVRPWLEQACVPLRCRVPYARDIDRIIITGSALKSADTVPAAPVSGHAGAATPPDEQRFVLQVTMRNQLGQPQEWPTLVLDLKDGSGTLLVRRNLSPADYLGPAAAGQPFAAHSDVLVRVPLTLTGVRINGYQLDLFFP
jgi:predicted Zn finger-like uncharacterized protein